VRRNIYGRLVRDRKERREHKERINVPGLSFALSAFFAANTFGNEEKAAKSCHCTSVEFFPVSDSLRMTAEKRSPPRERIKKRWRQEKLARGLLKGMA
jgi:hypothetical protein